MSDATVKAYLNSPISTVLSPASMNVSPSMNVQSTALSSPSYITPRDLTIVPSHMFEITSRNLVLPLHMTLLAVRQLIWKAMLRPAALMESEKNTFSASSLSLGSTSDVASVANVSIPMQPHASSVDLAVLQLYYRLRISDESYLTQSVQMELPQRLKLS